MKRPELEGRPRKRATIKNEWRISVLRRFLETRTTNEEKDCCSCAFRSSSSHRSLIRCPKSRFVHLKSKYASSSSCTYVNSRATRQSLILSLELTHFFKALLTTSKNRAASRCIHRSSMCITVSGIVICNYWYRIKCNTLIGKFRASIIPFRSFRDNFKFHSHRFSMFSYAVLAVLTHWTGF
jgi:hypothetical protein